MPDLRNLVFHEGKAEVRRFENSFDVKVLDKPRTLVCGHFEHLKVPNKPRTSVRGETQGLFDLKMIYGFRELLKEIYSFLKSENRIP
jgi:hypothetical protein